ncbi:DUF3905 domain-containing protein (plasmid) [Paenibacillus cellulosilyticus]|nr:DUF3905 domain-containing protein [Paenibacillus cellulosilyticus]QKS47502.1 DUF3905 domain-containing protein [Paenibacillus cellulosilyticus]
MMRYIGSSDNDRYEYEAAADSLRDDPELDPYEINFLPAYRSGRGPRGAFVNRYGVIIGDHMYASTQSPLEQWSTETDPAIMSGDEWVHPYKDIGFLTSDNRAIFEEGREPQTGGGMFQHPDKDVGYAVDEPSS